MTQELEQGTNATLVAVRNGPGARLRAAREANGFTQLEVAQQLRLSADMIARLEEDNYDPNMPLVFVKGYLRSYAGIIGLDPEQILIEFTHLGIKDPVREVPDLGQSPQRKLSNFNAGTPKHRPGLLWGSLALFACGMLAFMYMYRDQIPALSGPDGSGTTVSTTSSTEESELNAALEAARKANAQAATSTDAPAATTTTPSTGTGSTPRVEATTGASTASTGSTSTTGTTSVTSQTPSPATTASTTSSTKKPISSEEDDEDNARPMKPVSANNVVVPSTRAAVKSAAKRSDAKTHETMLF